MFVYVAVGAEVIPPGGGLRLFSSTSFDKLRDAWARFGGWLPFSVAGVLVPLVESPLSAGVAFPLISWGVPMEEASLREASPTMVLRFLFRRWLGFHDELRKFLWMECMSSFSMSSRWAIWASVGAAIVGEDERECRV